MLERSATTAGGNVRVVLAGAEAAARAHGHARSAFRSADDAGRRPKDAVPEGVWDHRDWHVGARGPGSGRAGGRRTAALVSADFRSGRGLRRRLAGHRLVRKTARGGRLP